MSYTYDPKILELEEKTRSEEIKLECYKLASASTDYFSKPRDPLTVAKELYAWVTDHSK